MWTLERTDVHPHQIIRDDMPSVRQCKAAARAVTNALIPAVFPTFRILDPNGDPYLSTRGGCGWDRIKWEIVY